MKKFLSLIFFTFAPLLFGFTQGPVQNVPQIDPFELLNSMDPKELDKLMDDLAKMSPEEIKYYEELGKQMFKQSGYDLDEIAKTFPAPAPAPLPAPQPTKQPEAPKQDKAKPSIDEPTKKERESLTRMIKSLGESLASIRQKAASDETLHPHLAPIQQELDLLAAYVNRLDYDRHLKHFAEKEFAALKTKLRKMSSMLEEFDANLTVPHLGLRTPSAKTTAASRTQDLKKAASLLQEFKVYMSNAFTSETLLTDIENLFKKHDQEALQIKKQIEEQQKKAGEQIKKLSTTNTGHFAKPSPVTHPQMRSQAQQASRGGYGSGGMQQPAYRPGGMPSGASPAQQQFQQNNEKLKAAQKDGQKAPKAGGAAGAGKADDKGKDTKEKRDQEVGDVQLSPHEQLKKIEKDLSGMNQDFARNKEPLMRIADKVKSKTAPDKADLDVLEPLIISLKPVKKEVETYLDKMQSREKDVQAIKKNKQYLADFYKNLTAFTDVFTEYKTLKFTGAPLTPAEEAALAEAKGYVDAFNTHAKKINELLTSTRAF